MSFTTTVAKNGIKKLLSEKWKLVMFLLIPIMMGGLFSLISGSSGQPKPVGILLITDNDESTLSKLLVRGFNQGPMAEMFISKKVKHDDAKKLMDKGKASVWLEIDKGFAQNYLDELPTKIKLVKNPSQNILPQIAETAVNLMADGGHYVQLLFSKELKQFNALLNGERVSDAQTALMSVQIKHTIDGLQEQLFPPQIKAVKQKIKKESDTSSTGSSFMQMMFPGILFMALLFSSQGMALEFWHDKTQGISRRLLSTPSGLGQYMNGKLLTSLFVYILLATVIGSLGLLLLKLDLTKIFIIIAWLMLSGLALGMMMLFVSLLMPTEKSANVVTSAMVFPLMMLGGSFFPFDAMPKWMVAIGQYLPNGYLLQSFNQWFLKGKPLSVLSMPLLIAIIFIIIMWFVNKSLLPKFVRTK